MTLDCAFSSRELDFGVTAPARRTARPPSAGERIDCEDGDGAAVPERLPRGPGRRPR